MIRIYTNISGSAENPVSRQTPSINGTRVHPGSSLQLTQDDWDALPDTSQDLLDDLTERGVLALDTDFAGTVVSADEETEAEEEESSADLETAETPEGVTPDATPEEGVDEVVEKSEPDNFDYEALLELSVKDVQKTINNTEPDDMPDLTRLLEMEQASDDPRKSLVEYFEDKIEQLAANGE